MHHMHAVVQADCAKIQSPEVGTLYDKGQALRSQIPFKIDTPLAQQVYQALLKPVPGPVPVATSPALAPAEGPSSLLPEPSGAAAYPDVFQQQCGNREGRG